MIRKTLLALAATLALGSAQAATFNFSGAVDFGNAAALGSVLSGQFSVADADVAALLGGDGELPFQTLQFSFLGQSYQLSDAAAGAYVTYELGSATGPNASFATNAGGSLSLQSFFGASNFTYTLNGAESSGLLSISAVPEPGTWALTLAGLALVGGLARRRQRAAA